MTYAIIYTRCAVHSDHSAQQQAQLCQRLATEKGYIIDNVFYDAGGSGNSTDRPALNAMLDWLSEYKEHKPVILVDDFCRLGRDPTVVHQICAKLTSKGAALEIASQEASQ